ncbi:MAG: hypothetical protein Q4G10_04350, partial [Bacteroidia bacterium]|nr:hypothetical protein [Bacteroidia bacterium]
MNWTHSATTAPAGTGDRLYYSTSDLTPTAAMTGTLAVNTKQKRITCANSFGSMTCAFYFYRYLENQGIIATEGPADISASGYIRDFTGEGEEVAAASRDSLTTIGGT